MFHDDSAIYHIGCERTVMPLGIAGSECTAPAQKRQRITCAGLNEYKAQLPRAYRNVAKVCVCVTNHSMYLDLQPHVLKAYSS